MFWNSQGCQLLCKLWFCLARIENDEGSIKRTRIKLKIGGKVPLIVMKMIMGQMGWKIWVVGSSFAKWAKMGLYIKSVINDIGFDWDLVWSFKCNECWHSKNSQERSSQRQKHNRRTIKHLKVKFWSTPIVKTWVNIRGRSNKWSKRCPQNLDINGEQNHKKQG